jgi:hypothetical protein
MTIFRKAGGHIELPLLATESIKTLEKLWFLDLKIGNWLMPTTRSSTFWVESGETVSAAVEA